MNKIHLAKSFSYTRIIRAAWIILLASCVVVSYNILLIH